MVFRKHTIKTLKFILVIEAIQVVVGRGIVRHGLTLAETEGQDRYILCPLQKFCSTGSDLILTH